MANTLKRMHDEAGGRCFWCKQLTIHVGSLAPEDRLQQTQFVIHFPGGMGPIATIDHVIPKFYGGDNQPDNLVLSCAWCNTVRSTEPQRLPILRHCRECGKQHTQRKTRCGACRKRLRKLSLVA